MDHVTLNFLSDQLDSDAFIGAYSENHHFEKLGRTFHTYSKKACVTFTIS